MDNETIKLIKLYNKIQPSFGPDVPIPNIITKEEVIEEEPQQQEGYNEVFAKIAGEAYKPISERGDIDKYKYNQDESTDELAVFESAKDYTIGIRGTSKENIIPHTFQDILVGAGSLTSLVPDQLGLGLKSIQKKVDKLKQRKPVILSGHSLGGSKASMLGVLDDELQVYTYNKGDVLPFLSDTAKCSITGCKNIKNYRIAGDIVSGIGSMYSTQNIETLAPKQLEPEKEKLFSATENIVPKNLYIPHAMDQFIDRKKLYPKSTFPRKLYSQTGHYAGIGLGMVYGPQILSKIGDKTITPILDTLIEAGGLEDKEYKKYQIELEKIMEEELESGTTTLLVDEAQKKMLKNIEKIPFVNTFIPTNALRNTQYGLNKLNNRGIGASIGGYIGSNLGGYIYDLTNPYIDDDTF
jgi:hypothetical protein